MSKKTYLLAVLSLFFIQMINAQFPQDGTYQHILPPNTPAMPDYGQTIIDNSVPTPIEITRITEHQSWGYPTHEYAKTQVWNADQTKYKISSWKVYNATTYAEEQELSSMYPSYWSNTDPDIIWSFRENGDIKKFIVSTNTTQTVANILGYEVIKLGPGEGNIDKNDHYVALVGKKANGDLDVIVFDLQTNQVTQTVTFTNAWVNGGDNFPDYIDWVSISQSGDYVVILWSNPTGTTNWYLDQNNVNHYGVEVYDRTTMQYQSRIANAGNHGDLGYAVDGDEVFVQYKAGQAGVYMQKLNGTGETQVNNTTEITASGHISCRNINRPGWAYVTQATSANSSSNQIVAIKLDNSGIVEHFGHHFSSDMSYDQSPMAVASPNGDKICFHSDFGTDPVNNSEVAYSFIASIDNTATVNEEQLNTLNIYPNPTKDVITIQGKANTLYTIYDYTGKLIFSKKANTVNTTIDLSELNSGVYLMKATLNNNTSFSKIIKR